MSNVIIEPVAIQNIPVGTADYELNIQTQNVTEAMEIVADGDWDGGFYHTWDQTTGIISIKNENAALLLSGRNWRLSVEDSGVEVASRVVEYNVVPAAPVIDIITTPYMIYKGVPFEALIPVSNSPGSASIRSRLVGMKSPGPVEGGVMVSGNIPRDLDVDFSTFDAPLFVQNAAGSHSRDIPFEISAFSAPGIPINVTTTETSEQITVNWQPPSDTGGQPIIGYEVRIGDEDWIRKGVNDRSHTFAGLNSDRSYTVYVRSRTSIGYSDVAEVVIALSSAAAQAQGTSIRFSWNPPSEALDYEVKIGDGQWIPKGLTARSHTFTGLTAGQSYTVYGRERKSVGYSDEVSRTVVIPGQVPDDISVLFHPAGAPSYSVSKWVSWGAASQATGYQIKYNSGQWQTLRGRTDAASIQVYPTNETITVRATNEHGYGPERSYSYSNPTTPLNPTLLRSNLSVASGQITVTWVTPSPPSGYVYLRTLVLEGTNERRVEGTGTTFAFTGLTNGRGYTIRLRSMVASADGRVRILGDNAESVLNSQSIAIFNTPTITQQDNWDSGSESVFIRWSYTPLTSETPWNFQSSIDNGSTWVNHGDNNPGNTTIEDITDEPDDTTVLFRAADINGIGGPATSFVVRT